MTLFHEYESSPAVDQIKLIGIYSSEKKAKAALERVRDKPGFRDHPEGFEITKVLLDRDDWREGFGPA
jgi:hypothetical protein